MSRSRELTKHLYRWLRALHLYGGLFVGPFVLVFAVSTILFNHTWKPWTSQSEAKVEQKTGIEIPTDKEGLAFAQSIMQQVDVSGEVEFFNYRPQQQRMGIPVMTPSERIQITLDVENRTARIERNKTGFWDTLLYLHKSPGPHLAGFRGNWVYTRVWRWLADATVYLVLLVSVSGIYLWSVLRAERRIGYVLIGAGTFSFFALVLLIVH